MVVVLVVVVVVVVVYDIKVGRLVYCRQLQRHRLRQYIGPLVLVMA